jgi:hypothetical protein
MFQSFGGHRNLEVHVNDSKLHAGSCITGTVRLLTKYRGPLHLVFKGTEETVIEEPDRGTSGSNRNIRNRHLPSYQ